MNWPKACTARTYVHWQTHVHGQHTHTHTDIHAHTHAYAQINSRDKQLGLSAKRVSAAASINKL